MLRLVWLFALVGCLLTAPISSRADDSDETSQHVIVLSKKNFATTIDSHDLTLVEFFAPWCGHCKSLKPEYDNAAEQLADNDAIALATVDATVETGLASKHSISGYPTLRLFRRGKSGAKDAQDYEGPRSAEGIAKFMRSMTGPAITDIATQEELTAFTKQVDDSTEDPSPVIVLGFFGKSKASKRLVKTFAKTADKLRAEFSFGRTTNQDLFASFGARKDSVAVYRRFDQQTLFYDGSVKSSKKLAAFVRLNSIPIMGRMTQANAAKFRAPGRPLARLFIAGETMSTQALQYAKHVHSVALDLRESLTFAVADAFEFAYDLEQMGLSVRSDIFVIGEPGNIFLFKDDYFTEVNIGAFCEDFLEGKLRPEFKSAPPPPASQKEHVTVAVGTTIEALVTDPSVDVLVEFYAPWCGHCQKLVPIYGDLAKSFRAVPSVRIVEMDSTANDIPRSLENLGVEVSGYPTLFFIPAKANAPAIRYDESERDLDHLSAFIGKHAVHEQTKQFFAKQSAKSPQTDDKDEL